MMRESYDWGSQSKGKYYAISTNSVSVCIVLLSVFHIPIMS